ncbi:MAG: photosynthetic complex putative assembly protein PuhB, partial [Myxococcota bacterium]
EHIEVPGLNPNESVLWQGRPSRRFLSRYVFRAPWVGAYLAAMVVLRGVFAASSGAQLGETVLAMLFVLPLALTGWGILELMAWAHARTTLYTLTERRVVMRFGVALDLTVNLPFKGIRNASFALRRSGFGDIAIELGGAFRAPHGELVIPGPSYFHLWPHARPWHMAMPQPTLRGVEDVATVARVFAEALDTFRREHEDAPDEVPVGESSAIGPRPTAGELTPAAAS